MIKLDPVGEHSWVLSDGDNDIKGLVSKDYKGEYILLNDKKKNKFISFDQLQTFLSNDGSVLKINKRQNDHERDQNYFIRGYPIGYSSPHLVDNINYNDLPLFTKIKDSNILYCAGYYCLKFSKSWMNVFCPKLSTIKKYEYLGPFHSREEAQKIIKKIKENKS